MVGFEGSEGRIAEVEENKFRQRIESTMDGKEQMRMAVIEIAVQLMWIRAQLSEIGSRISDRD